MDFLRPSQRVRVYPEPTYSDEEYLSLLQACGGYYSVPMDSEGTAHGPLVGYSGRYKDIGSGGQELQYVGFRYFNLALTEQYPHVADIFARGVASKMQHTPMTATPDCVIGVPEGGKIIGYNVARHLDILFAGLEKKVVEPATATSKEKTALVLGRHSIEDGMNVVLCEDLVNNFSTTSMAIEVVRRANGQVVGIICGLNRSERKEYNGIPVVSLVHRPTPQYRQDDPAVATHIARVGIVLDVKPNWAKLDQAMREAASKGIPLY